MSRTSLHGDISLLGMLLGAIDPAEHAKLSAGRKGDGVTKLLQQAFDEATKLSEKEQNALAALLLSEIDSERQWDEAFAGSQEALLRLAQEALVEHRAGLTQDLDPDQL